MSDNPEAPADPVAAEDGSYAAIVSDIRGLRRNGAMFLEAVAHTAFYRVALMLAQQEPDEG